MTKCLVCGKKNAGWLCLECSPSCNKEKLCNDFCVYNTGKGQNEIWNAFADCINNDVAFEIIDFLCENFSEGLRAYYRILYLSKNNRYIRKNDVDVFLDIAQIAIKSEDITIEKKNRIRGLLLDVYTNMHNYFDAESIASFLLNETELSKYAIHSMIVFYVRTRRYVFAEKLAKTFLDNNINDSYYGVIDKEYSDLKKRREGAYKEYVPLGENAEKYFAFLETLGFKNEKTCLKEETVKVYKKTRGIPKPIPRDKYPIPQKADETYYNDFVAFDVETTGKDVVKDSIIEISAVKVKDGKIVDTFSELVKPIDKKISAQVEQLTGISNDDVINAREIWEVFPDFAKFIEDNVLVGYNSLAFDSRVLVRAGRYSHIILQNKHLDVMHYSRKYLRQQGISNVISLVKLGEMLEVVNPQAHRALADAETTAKIYLKLLEFEM